METTEPSLSFADVYSRSTRGLLALTLRGGAGKLITIASNILLYRLLAPVDFGVFAILQLPIALLNLVADAGISAALVQRNVLTPAGEQAGFTLRLALAAGCGLLLALGAGVVGGVYDLSNTAVWALRLLAAGPLLNALATVPGVRLTRSLRFGRLAWAEMGSLVAGQAVALWLAWNGAGLWSLVFSSLATVTAGTLLVNLFAPWRPRLASLSASAASGLLRFGLPYQGQGVLHMAKDQIIPALGGLLLSGTQVGYLVWAQEIARWPRLPADYVARVGFPAFARLQQDPAGLSRLLQRALALVCTVSFVAVAVAIPLSPALVGPIFGPEWEPAVSALILFLAQTPLDALAAVLLPLIYATGHARQGLRLSAVWAALTWLFSLVALALGAGLHAIPLAFGLGSLLAIILIIHSLPPTIRVKWIPAVGAPFALALLVSTVMQVLAGL